VIFIPVSARIKWRKSILRASFCEEIENPTWSNRGWYFNDVSNGRFIVLYYFQHCPCNSYAFKLNQLWFQMHAVSHVCLEARSSFRFSATFKTLRFRSFDIPAISTCDTLRTKLMSWEKFENNFVASCCVILILWKQLAIWLVKNTLIWGTVYRV
jgi:hypothetical protein